MSVDTPPPMQCSREKSDPRIGVQAIRGDGKRVRRPPPPSPLVKPEAKKPAPTAPVRKAKPASAPKAVEPAPTPKKEQAAPAPKQAEPKPTPTAIADPAPPAEEKAAPPQKSGEEFRRHTRIEYETEVSMESGSQFFTGFTRNISAGGLFMATHDVRDLGTIFRLRFNIPEIRRNFDVEAEVRWVCPPNPHRPEQTPGMGVNFLDLPDKDRRILDAYIAKRETIFFDDDDDD